MKSNREMAVKVFRGLTCDDEELLVVAAHRQLPVVDGDKDVGKSQVVQLPITNMEVGDELWGVKGHVQFIFLGKIIA